MDPSFVTRTPALDAQIKRRYSDFIVEEIAQDGRKCACTVFPENLSPPALQIPGNPQEKEYLQADLEKMNQDLPFACKRISRQLGVSVKRVSYAGLKDKRAITCQRISIWKPPLERLKGYYNRNPVLKNLDWSDEKIDLGMLRGNAFTLTLRNIALGEAETRETLSRFFAEIQGGVPNYFGSQRFGGIRGISHLVGKAILQGNLEEAVMIYLAQPAEKEPEEITRIRKGLGENRDYKKALQAFPLNYRFERVLLHHLAGCPKDFAGAFGKLPKKFRYLFTHALQSHVFNRVLGKRIQEGIGLLPVEGEPVNKENVPLGLLPGYESAFTPGKIGELEKQAMEEENLALAQFKVKTPAECSSRGNRRPIVLFPKNCRILQVREDEFSDGRIACTLYFELEKGAYATTVLRELIKKDEFGA